MEEMKDKIFRMIDESIRTKENLKQGTVQRIIDAAEMIISSLKEGNKILIAGNGGSASQASHFAGELVGRYMKERKALPAISLSTDTSVITAWSNDYSYETVFSRQVEALGKEGDTLIVISTSGNSKNLITALEEAKKQGMNTIALLGKEGGKTKGIADLDIIVEGESTPRIQEAHILIIHALCEIAEESIEEHEER